MDSGKGSLARLRKRGRLERHQAEGIEDAKHVRLASLNNFGTPLDREACHNRKNHPLRSSPIRHNVSEVRHLGLVAG